MRGGYDRVEGSICKSYDEIKGVTMSMSRDFYMLGKITTGKVEKLDCLSIAEVVDMDVEVAGNDEFMRGGGCMGKPQLIMHRIKCKVRVFGYKAINELAPPYLL